MMPFKNCELWINLDNDIHKCHNCIAAGSQRGVPGMCLWAAIYKQADVQTEVHKFHTAGKVGFFVLLLFFFTCLSLFL